MALKPISAHFDVVADTDFGYLSKSDPEDGTRLYPQQLDVFVETTAFMRLASRDDDQDEDDQTIEVEVWNRQGTQRLAILGDRSKPTWLDDLNDVGSGSFTINSEDPKAHFVEPGNHVCFRYRNRPRFWMRIEQVTYSPLTEGGWDVSVSGRGLMALYEDGVVYPEWLPMKKRETEQVRRFFHGSQRGYIRNGKPEGFWFHERDWRVPRGMRYGDVPDDHPFKNIPEGWPEENAYWLWRPNPINDDQKVKEAVFRRRWIADVDYPRAVIYAAASDEGQLWWDGKDLGELSGPGELMEVPLTIEKGRHILSSFITNTDEKSRDTVVVENWESMEPDGSSNYPFASGGALHGDIDDGNGTYCRDDGSTYDGGPAASAFDGDESTYWLSVGTRLGWKDAVQWVQGKFDKTTVRTVRVAVKGGPYADVYISLGTGGDEWEGDQHIPYDPTWPDADTHAGIPYVKKVRMRLDESRSFNVPETRANRIRVTAVPEWDSQVGRYRHRFGVVDVEVSKEAGTKVDGGNYAGFIACICELDRSGRVIGTLIRTRPSEAWLYSAKDPLPGWTGVEIVRTLIEEAKLRDVVLRPTGFTPRMDSYRRKWDLERHWWEFNVGDSMLSVFQKVSEDDDIDLWIEPVNRRLLAAPRRGHDRRDSVIFRAGAGVLSADITRNRPTATTLIVETEKGWFDISNRKGEHESGVVERQVSYGDAPDMRSARRSAKQELRREAFRSYDVGITIDPNRPGIRPYRDFGVGDLVSVAVERNEPPRPFRVLSISMSEEGAAGSAKCTVELDDWSPDDLIPGGR